MGFMGLYNVSEEHWGACYRMYQLEYNLDQPKKLSSEYCTLCLVSAFYGVVQYLWRTDMVPHWEACHKMYWYPTSNSWQFCSVSILCSVVSVGFPTGFCGLVQCHLRIDLKLYWKWEACYRMYKMVANLDLSMQCCPVNMMLYDWSQVRVRILGDLWGCTASLRTDTVRFCNTYRRYKFRPVTNEADIMDNIYQLQCGVSSKLKYIYF